MAIIKCKMCGGDLELIANQSVAECEYCGSRQTVPTADNEKKLTLFARAGRLRGACEFDKAAGIYESIVADFPEEAEAYWGLVLCKYGIEYVDDPATGKKIPTCHRSSFDSIMEDSDFEQTLENADGKARRVYREEAKAIEEIRKGIIAVSANEEPYDIFICYKETDANGDRTLDSVLAQDIYDALTDKDYRVFFSRITLEDKLGQEYEPYIFAALNSAKIMLAVGTDYEYFNAVWVKNEWSRFLKLMAADKSKHLIPCFKGIDAYDMPKEFARLQAQDLGKVGAMQDLLRGIEKILPKQKNTTVMQEKVVVGGSGNNKIASLLDRGNMALEDGDWAKADSFFEDVLNNDSKNAQAYLGKTLAMEKCRTIDAFARKRKSLAWEIKTNNRAIPREELHIREMEERYSLAGYLTAEDIRELYQFELYYPSTVRSHQERLDAEIKYWAEHKLLARAEKFAHGAVAESIAYEKQAIFSYFTQVVKNAEATEADERNALTSRYQEHIAKSDKTAARIHEEALENREGDYEKYLQILKSDSKTIYPIQEAERFFLSQSGFRDSDALAGHCRKRIRDLKEEAERLEAERKAVEAAEAERQRLEREAEKERKRQEAEQQRILKEKKEAEHKAKNKKIGIISAVAAVLVIAVIVVMTKVVIPRNNYSKAEDLLEDRKYAEAAITFGRLGEYNNAHDRAMEVWKAAAFRDSIAADYCHSVALKTDGTVIAVSSNNDGQCNVTSWNDIVAISAGNSHTVGLKSDGTVVAVGDNDYGELDVSDWKGIVAISAGSCHTVGLKYDGTVVAVGYNSYGQCNVSDWENIVAVSAGSGHTVGLKSDGTVVAVGDNTDGECNVSAWTDIVAVSAGWSFTVGLKSDGTVVAAGENDDGECNVAGWTNIVAIAAGGDHAVGLRTDGTVVATGWNAFGECDISDWRDIVAISVGANHTLGLKSDGTLIAMGQNTWNQCDVYGWTDIKLPE